MSHDKNHLGTFDDLLTAAATSAYRSEDNDHDFKTHLKAFQAGAAWSMEQSGREDNQEAT